LRSCSHSVSLVLIAEAQQPDSVKRLGLLLPYVQKCPSDIGSRQRVHGRAPGARVDRWAECAVRVSVHGRAIQSPAQEEAVVHDVSERVHGASPGVRAAGSHRVSFVRTLPTVEAQPRKPPARQPVFHRPGQHGLALCSYGTLAPNAAGIGRSARGSTRSRRGCRE